MKRDLLENHFQKSGFDDMQSETLAAVLTEFREEMATKQDMSMLRAELSAVRIELKGDISTLRAALKGDFSTLRAELKGDISTLRSEMTSATSGLRTEMQTMKADLTWRFVALVVFLAALQTLLGLFVS